MNQLPRLVSLGFTSEKFPAGTHICQIYSDEDERNESLFQFLRSGLESDERVACFSDKVNESALTKFLETHEIILEDAKASGNLNIAGTTETYFQDNRFDPDRMLGLLAQFEVSSKEAGCPNCRAIGEMNPVIQEIEGGSRLLEYESRVSMLLRDHPVTTVCQYNATEFNGATIMDVLNVHPWTIIRGSIIKNPFFIPPEQFLKQQLG